MKAADPLAGIAYISIHDLRSRRIGDFELDPDIRLPVELPEGGSPTAENISWQAIISAMLKVLAYRPESRDADYYRRFVLAVHPGIKEEFTQAGIVKVEQGEVDLAIEIFRSMAALLPRCGETRNNLALAYERKAQDCEGQGWQAQAEEYRELAFAAYKAALELEPELAVCHLNFAHFYLRRNNAEKAREHLDKFLKHNQDPQKAEAAKILSSRLKEYALAEQTCAEALDAIQLGREAEAIRALVPLTGAHPGLWNAWFLLGWAHRRLARYGEAEQAFLKALELNGRSPDLLNELAICSMELNDLEESRRRLEAALQMDPENPKMLSNLGLLALKRGDEREAARLFRFVLERYPDDPIAGSYIKK